MTRIAKPPRAPLTPWVMSVTIVGLLLVCYWPALHGGMLWDDPAHVTKPELRSWAGLGRIWTDVHATQQYYPVLHSAFWTEHRLWGDATLGYHLLNVLLQAAACVLLALVLRALWEPARKSATADPRSRDSAGQPAVPPGAEWLAALLFAVHPTCVESVAWISEQKNVLSLVFYLSAALAYLQFATQRRWRWYLFALTLFVLALGTKSVTATLPAALLVVLWWKNGRLRWRPDVVPLLPWFLAAAVAGLNTARIEFAFLGARGPDFDLSLAERGLLAGRVIWFYLGKLAWPSGLMFIYPRWNVHAEAVGWLPWLAGVVAVSAVLWLLRRRTRGPLACWLFFIGSLFPALGFFNVFPFVFSYVADHFQYLASLGVIVAVAVGIARGCAWLPSPFRPFAVGLCVVLVGGLTLLSNRESRNYRSAVVLYRATLTLNPDCWMAHNNLAAELEKSPKDVPEALAHYAEAMRLKPDHAQIHDNLGSLLQTLGREEAAVAQFTESVRLDPTALAARLNLAHALAGNPRRFAEAMAIYAGALRQAPDDPAIHLSLAVTLVDIGGREEDALQEFATTLHLQPTNPEAHASLANLLARLPGRGAGAEREYQTALGIDPASAKTHYNYAVWLERQPGRIAEAVQHYDDALAIDPDYPQAHNNLGIIFAQDRQFDQARAQWEAAVKANPNYEDARRNLRLLDERTRR